MTTAVARAQPAASRVQGIQSTLSDLAFHDGRDLGIAIGGSITKTPTLKRTIGSGSSISLSINDPDGDFLQGEMLGEKFDADLDGLIFRLHTIAADEPLVNLTLEERCVSQLRELKGPVKVYAKRGQPDEVTRAEFILSLIRKVKPAIPYHIPELHKQQPIKSEAQGKAAKDEAKANRGKGIGDVKGLTVKGEKAKPEQVEAGERALRVCQSHKAPFRVCVAVMEALIVEDELGTLTGNWLQLIPSTASESGISPHDLESSVAGFLTGYIPGEQGALGYFRSHPQAEPYEIAQAVQKSGAGKASDGAANYGPWAAEARTWVETFEGGEFANGGAETVVEARTWEVEKGENYWEAIKRLAKEVNWRAFFVAGRFFYLDEIDLFRGMVRLAVDRDTPGIQHIKGKIPLHGPVTELEIEAYADQWSVPPGAVITITEYGPFSIGFGDAPVKANSKGQKAGLSGNRKAATGEGHARYIVESIESPLRDDEADARLVTIKARKPTAPLSEPAKKTKSVSAGESATGSNATAQELHDWLESQIGKPYIWGATGPSGYDCSGYVSKGLMTVGLLKERLTTSGFATYGEAGAGEFITIHDKTGSGNPKTEHVVIEVLGDVFECGGISGGVGKPNYSAPELAAFNVKRHPKGL